MVGSAGLRHFMRHDFGRLQALGVYVVQGECTTRKLGKIENVAHEVHGEDGAAGADEGDLGHVMVLGSSRLALEIDILACGFSALWRQEGDHSGK